MEVALTFEESTSASTKIQEASTEIAPRQN